MRTTPALATDGVDTLLSFLLHPQAPLSLRCQGQMRLPIDLPTYQPPPPLSCQLILHISGAWLYNI